MKTAFFQGKFVPFADAKIGIMTHAFNYGTGVFEGVRGYWNLRKKQLYILRLKEHFERLQVSALALNIKLKYSLEEMIKITVELCKRNDYKEDVYIRPLAYKSEEKIGLGLTGIADDFCMFVSPFGAYLDISKGINVCISSWRRIGAQSLPQGAKIT
jgi:branched-chain amino acid aminotransferase